MVFFFEACAATFFVDMSSLKIKLLRLESLDFLEERNER